jgi:hypothetical protein
MRRDIWPDDSTRDGGGAVTWSAVLVVAVVVGVVVGQFDWFCGVCAGLLVVVAALARMVCREEPGQE